MDKEEAIKRANEIIKNSFDSEDDIELVLKKLLNLVQQLQEESKQKDKIIDEIIEEYEFFHRANIINFCEDKLRKNVCIQDCKLCIKQYFEKKAGEE